MAPADTCDKQTLDEKEYEPAELPIWNFDGSSTGQAPGENSDVYLKPVAVFPDPFRLGKNILVLAECWNSDGAPNKYNYRHEAAKLMEAHAEQEPWFGLEQEYTLLDLNDRPYGWYVTPFAPKTAEQVLMIVSTGPRTATPPLRARTTAVSAPARSCNVISLRRTTVLACTPVSRSLVPTPRSCVCFFFSLVPSLYHAVRPS